MKEADGRMVSLILPEKEVERKGDERRDYAIVMRFECSFLRFPTED